MPKYSQVIENVGDETMYRRAPTIGLISVLMAALYILILIAFLKILKIIPDPPEALDVTALIINGGVAVASGLLTYIIKSFMGLQTKLATMETSVNELRKDMQNGFKDLNLEIKHMRDQMDLSTRIARLEARKE